MTDKEFESVVNSVFERCGGVLISKASEYARGDRLSNFKNAAALAKSTPEKALRGMLAKHIVSLWDLIDDLEGGNNGDSAIWDEKITDSINYLILLTGLIRERFAPINTGKKAPLTIEQMRSLKNHLVCPDREVREITEKLLIGAGYSLGEINEWRSSHAFPLAEQLSDPYSDLRNLTEDELKAYHNKFASQSDK